MPSQLIQAGLPSKPSNNRFATIAISVASVLLMSSAQVLAQTWDGDSDSNFTNASNFSGNVAPTPGSSVTINNGGLVNQPTLNSGDSLNVNSISIAGGSLGVSGDLTSSNGITVSGGGALNISSTGVVTGNVTALTGSVTNGGTIFGDVATFSSVYRGLTGGNIAGNLSNNGGLIDLGENRNDINGDLSILGGTLSLDLTNGQNSLLIVQGNASLGGRLELDFTEVNFSDQDFFRFDLLTTRSTIFGDFAAFSLIGFNSGFSFRTEQVNLKGDGFQYSGIAERNVVTSVPEPETYAMMLAGLGLVGSLARRRKAKLAS